MTWKYEIYRGFFVAFGAMQIIANLNYIMKENGMESARKQHCELPVSVSNKQMRAKTMCMLVIGVIFFITGAFSFFTRSFNNIAFAVVLGIYIFYAFIEAIYYRFWRTIMACILAIILFIIYLL